jgi:hypothetical protein
VKPAPREDDGQTLKTIDVFLPITYKNRPPGYHPFSVTELECGCAVSLKGTE